MTIVNGITILLGGAGFLLSDFIMERREMGEVMEVHAEIIAMNCRAALMFNDKETAKSILSSLEVVSDIQDVLLFDVNGNLFANYKRPGHKDEHFLENSKEVDFGLWNDYIIMKQPVILDGEQIGTLMIHALLKEVYEEGLRAVLLIALVLAIVLPVSVILAFKMQRVISQPVEALRRAAMEIGQGNFATDVAVYSQDEIGELAEAFRAMSKDLAEQRADLERANQAKSDFLANMSHEIRTPMNALVGLTDLALQTETSLRTKDYLSKIAYSSRSLLRIINDILDFSKIEAGKLELEHSPFLLREVLDHLLDLFRVQAGEKNIELIMIMAKECRLELLGDSLRLEQILMNLIANALKFTEQGEVEVKVELLSSETRKVALKFSVRDSGIGMDDQQVSKLFAPFAQGDTSTTRKYGGTGLGLSICQRLVGLMGGELWVESKVGVGSQFSFVLSFDLADSTVHAPLLPPDEMHGLKCLVVAAHHGVRQGLLKNFEMFGFSVTGVASGDEGLQIIRETGMPQAFLLLVVDWRMSDMDAMEFMQKAVALYPRGTTPKRILLTPFHREKEIITLANRVGVDACLAKPIHCSMLFDTVMTVFGKDVAKVYRPATDLGGGEELQEVISRIGGAEILLVEDNAINQQVAREILEGVGVQVTVANHGEEALALLAGHAFDAVLMDIQMPVMDGYTATRQLRGQACYQELPIIAMTAHAMTGDREKSLAAGMNDHVAKPIVRRELFKALIKWVQPRSQAAIQTALVTPQEEAMEKIAGIQVETGLARLNGNSKLFRSLLLEFWRDYAQITPQIRLLLDQRGKEKWPTAARMVHTVRGIAGNIAALEVFESAGELEREIGRLDVGGVALAMNRFDLALQEVMEGIATWKAKEERREEEEPSVENGVDTLDRPALAALMQELEGLLQQANVKSLSRFALLQEKLLGIKQAEEVLYKMALALERYDFSTSRTVLLELAQTLDITWTN
ncbi:MAG: response regulator [Magnetococcales bacterium]|nr:response regulator [Magnetococcales bacterium]NGZ26356.1 response regulator [Magnetococcales bacterium]